MHQAMIRVVAALTLATGGPALAEDTILIEVPDLRITGAPDPVDMAIDVPALVIFGVEGFSTIEIEVPPLVIIGDAVGQ